MSIQRKRKITNNLLSPIEIQSKRCNNAPSSKDNSQNELEEIALEKLTPQERQLSINLFKFNEIVTIHFWSICEIEIARSIKVIWWGWKILDANTPPFVLCFKWFSSGKETDSHKRYHSYYILDRMEFPLFIKSWSAFDELMLLKSISQWGIDNWGEVSEQLYCKSSIDWDSQFYLFYYKSQEDSLPKPEDIWVVRRDKTTNEVILDESKMDKNQHK